MLDIFVLAELVLLFTGAMLTGCAVNNVNRTGNNNLLHAISTWQGKKFKNIEKQQTDFTCGAASLATVIKYFIGNNVSEAEITSLMRQFYDDKGWAKIERDGLSMLDIKRAAEKLGLSAEGYHLNFADLEQLKGPVLVHLNKSNIQHFSVLKGIIGDRAYIADPIGGNLRIPLYRFLAEWTGYVMVVWNASSPLPNEYPLLIKNPGIPEVSVVRRSLYVEPFATQSYR